MGANQEGQHGDLGTEPLCDKRQEQLSVHLFCVDQMQVPFLRQFRLPCDILKVPPAPLATCGGRLVSLGRRRHGGCGVVRRKKGWMFECRVEVQYEAALRARAEKFLGEL